MEGVANADHYEDVERDVSALAQRLFASGTVASTLQEIVSLAEEAVDGCDAAGILTVEGNDAPHTAAAGSPLAATVDKLQIDADEGPCLDAARTGATFYAADLSDDVRWPIFGPLAVDAGVRTMLAYSLSAQRMSALNLYGGLPTAFGAVDRAKGQLFATLARYALDAAEAQAAEEAKSAGLSEALGTRELIGQAQGILMEREKITADQAFDVLRRASQHLNVKLRAIAAALVETGESPDLGPEPNSA